MFGFILEELLHILENIARTHHAWNATMTQEDALQRIESLREKLSVAQDNAQDQTHQEETQS